MKIKDLKETNVEWRFGLSDDEIKAKVQEAEKHKEEDKKKKESIDIRNEADATIFRAEKALSDYKDKLPEIARSVQLG